MSKSIRERTQSLAATALTGTATVLSTVAKLAGETAGLLRPSENGGAAEAVTADDIADTYEQRGAVKPRTQVSVPDVPAHAQVPASHAAEIADGTVAQVTAAIPELSTDELRMLLEHETAHKNRRGVLDAIEQALTP
jgi:hypothetical protein